MLELYRDANPSEDIIVGLQQAVRYPDTQRSSTSTTPSNATTLFILPSIANSNLVAWISKPTSVHPWVCPAEPWVSSSRPYPWKSNTTNLNSLRCKHSVKTKVDQRSQPVWTAVSSTSLKHPTTW